MSNKPSKKKVVVTTTSKDADRSPASARTRSASTTSQRALTFNRQTYIWMGVGFALVLVGMMLMSGGHMPSADVWEDDIIYSFRRTVLAPIVILAGLVVAVFAIFKK
jgi:FtsH-binding integral membrane protein